MIEWEDFIKNKEIYEFFNREKTDIKCPNCGAVLYRRTDIVLTSFPPKYKYECVNCEWTGNA